MSPALPIPPQQMPLSPARRDRFRLAHFDAVVIECQPLTAKSEVQGSARDAYREGEGRAGALCAVQSLRVDLLLRCSFFTESKRQAGQLVHAPSRGEKSRGSRSTPTLFITCSYIKACAALHPPIRAAPTPERHIPTLATPESTAF